MKSEALGLILTYRCTSKCKMCCVDAGPNRKEEMKLGEALKCVRQAAEIGIQTISLTGGEPFLCFDKMLKICHYASQLGLKVNTLTNCFWAESQSVAEEKLAKLKESGLEGITIAADDFHQEFVPLEYVKRCYMAARELGLSIELRSVAAKNTKRIGYFATEIGASEDKTLTMRELPIVPVGRGAKLNPEILVYPSFKSPCPFVLKIMAVEPNGDLAACCGVGGFSSPFIVGNIKKHSLRKLVKEAKQNLLYNCLEIYGPQTLLEIMREKGFNPVVSNKHVDRCHICFDLFTNDKNQHMIKKTLKLIADELILGRELFDLLDELPSIINAEKMGLGDQSQNKL